MEAEFSGFNLERAHTDVCEVDAVSFPHVVDMHEAIWKLNYMFPNDSKSSR